MNFTGFTFASGNTVTQPSNVLDVASMPLVQTALFIAWVVAKRERLYEHLTTQMAEW